MFAATNIIIVSDHGMVDLKEKNFRRISDFVDVDKIEKVIEREAVTLLALKNADDVDEVSHATFTW